MATNVKNRVASQMDDATLSETLRILELITEPAASARAAAHLELPPLPRSCARQIGNIKLLPGVTAEILLLGDSEVVISVPNVFTQELTLTESQAFNLAATIARPNQPW